MRGGQYVNNWRMAELHAREAPARVRELEAWGAVFDRTEDGRILQRNFGGHRYPRLAHVGDRTGLEMIRTLQDHGIHRGIDVHMEFTVLSLLKDGDRIAGVLGYERERGRFKVFSAAAVVLATGGIGRAYKITSNSWEYTGDGHSLAYRAGAELIDMEFVQFHPTGMIWPPSVQGILVTEGVRGEGGILLNSAGRRFMFDDIPDAYKNQTADNEDEGWRYTQGDKSARRPPELLTRDHVARCHRPRGQGRTRQPARRRVPRHRVDPQAPAERGGSHQAEAAEHVPSVQAARRHRHHEGADGDRSDDALRDGRRARRRRHADVGRAGIVRCRGMRRGHQRRQPARRKLAVGSARLREARGRVCGALREGDLARPHRSGAGGRGSEAVARAVRAGAQRKPVQHPARSAGDHAEARRDRPDRGRDAAGADGARAAEGTRRAGGGQRTPGIQPGLAHGDRSAEPADRVGSRDAMRDRAEGKPRRPFPRRLSGQGAGVRHDQHRRASGGRWVDGGPPRAASARCLPS